MLTIDGSHGEGGGQVLRGSLALALATGTPFAITRIRAKRSKPGLLRQHLTCVLAARAVSGATVTGARLGSTELTFAPGPLAPGDYRFDIGSAGSTMLVAQALLPALLAEGGAWSLELTGGTHNPAAPSFEFFTRTLAPVLGRMGAPVSATLHVAGFYPVGGGRVIVEVAAGARRRPLVLRERGAITGRHAIAAVARMPTAVAEREVATATRLLGWPREVGAAVELASPGPGNTVTLVVEAERVTEVFTGHLDRGVAAEELARAVARECAAYLSTTAPVGEHLADQLLVPMALGGGGEFVTVEPSLHTRTQVDVIRAFLGVEVGLTPRDDGVWLASVPARV
jgi:RNA 3'-terminal phosphate cyclase (ATP)